METLPHKEPPQRADVTHVAPDVQPPPPAVASDRLGSSPAMAGSLDMASTPTLAIAANGGGMENDHPVETTNGLEAGIDLAAPKVIPQVHPLHPGHGNAEHAILNLRCSTAWLY